MNIVFLTNILPNCLSFESLMLEHFLALLYQDPLQEAQ
jgi:hypothetical protein